MFFAPFSLVAGALLRPLTIQTLIRPRGEQNALNLVLNSGVQLLIQADKGYIISWRGHRHCIAYLSCYLGLFLNYKLNT